MSISNPPLIRSTSNRTLVASKYGAIGDTITNESAFFAAFLGSGYKELVLDLPIRVLGQFTVPNGIRLVGTKEAKITQISGNTTFTLLLGDEDDIESIEFVHNGLIGAQYSGSPIFANSKGGNKIEGCKFSGHRSHAICFVDCQDSSIIQNKIFGSVADPLNINHSNSGFDIAIFDSAQNITVSGNRIDSGNGVGIGFQAVNTNKIVLDNTVSENVIRNSAGYGIMFYRLGAAVSYSNNRIKGNSLRNITGRMVHTSNGGIYGTAIYIQATPDINIIGNTIDTCCEFTDTPLLTQACIGIANTNQFLVADNTCKGSFWHGIHVNGANSLGVTDQVGLLMGNQVFSNVKHGIQVDGSQGIKVDSNVSAFNTGIGCYLLVAGSTNTNLEVVGNTFSKNGGGGLITAGTWSTPVIKDNTFRNNTGHGFGAVNALSSLIAKNNNSIGNTLRGYSFAAGSSCWEWSNNHSLSNGSADVLSSNFPNMEQTSGDVDLSISKSSPETQVFNTPLTANRAVTILTTANAISRGQEYHFIRTAAATGEFSITFPNGDSLATPSSWLTLKFNGATWFTKSKGSL